MDMKKLEVTVRRMKDEILSDVQDKVVPAEVASFSALHDHVDANCYGGFCDDAHCNAMIAAFGGVDSEGRWPQSLLEFVSNAQTAVDVWIKEGGISGKTEQPVVEPTLGPWSAESALSSDLYSIRYINGANGERVATVHRALGMSQEEALANARLIKALPEIMAVLKDVAQVLGSHPEFERGNSKVHYSVHKLKGAIDLAK